MSGPKTVLLEVIRAWPEGFERRLNAVWEDVRGFIPNVKLYDLQRVLAEFGLRMEVYEGEPEGTTHHLNSNRSVAVGDSFWQLMNTCPRGVKVQLLTVGRVAVYGVYRDGDDGYIGWAPVPKIPEGM